MAQTSLGGIIDAVGQPIFSSSTIQQHVLGSYTETQDGRGFRYFKNGAVIAVPGKVFQGPAQDTINQNPAGGLAVTAQSIGDFTVTLTGSLTLAADALAGGWMSVAVTPGQGYLYRVKGNLAVTAAANCLVTLEDPLQIALTTASKVVFQVNPYNGCLVAPATLTSAVTGVPVYAVAAAGFGWMQTKGPASCLQTGTGTCGTALGVLQGGTIGSLAPAVAGTPIIAHAFGTNVTGEYDLVNLVLD